MAIVGPSGSGKTSLLMLAAGLEKITEGRVFAAGYEVNTMNEDELALFRSHNIGIVFQSFHLIPNMTALENVAVPLELASVKNAGAEARKYLETVGLAHRIKHYPSELSGGEQQRVAVARAFSIKPKLLLLDEPTGNLDQRNGDIIMNLLFDMHRKEKTSFIMITHDMNLAKKCERIIKIVDGRVSEGDEGEKKLVSA